jgi:hypothetical protein
MNLFRRELNPTCEEELEKLRVRIRELEFTIAQNPAKLDIRREVLTIAGLDYSLALFERLGGAQGPSFLPIGAVFELVDRAGGSITLRHLHTEIDIRRAIKSSEERQRKIDEDMQKIIALERHDPMHD